MLSIEDIARQRYEFIQKHYVEPTHVLISQRDLDRFLAESNCAIRWVNHSPDKTEFYGFTVVWVLPGTKPTVALL